MSYLLSILSAFGDFCTWLHEGYAAGTNEPPVCSSDAGRRVVQWPPAFSIAVCLSLIFPLAKPIFLLCFTLLLEPAL